MSAFLLARRARAGGPGVTTWGLLLVVAAWSALAVNTTFGFVRTPVPGLLLIVFGVPAVVIAAAIFRRGEHPDPALNWAAAWSALLTAALSAAVLVDAEPVFGLLVPAVAVTAIACARRPAAAVVSVFFLTGAFGSLEAIVGLPTGEMVDLVLAGVWGAVLWGFFVSERERPIWVWPGVAFAAVYVGITAVAVLFADPFFGGLFGFRASAWYLAAFLLVAYAPWTRATYHRMAAGFVWVAAAVGAYATFRWFVGPADSERALALSVNPEYQFLYGDLVLFGSFPGGKQLAAWTAIAIPFCLAYALSFTGRSRYVAAVAVALCAVGLLGSEARSGFVGAVLGIALVLVLYQLSSGVPGLHLGVTAAAAVLVIGTGLVVLGQKDDDSLERYTILLTDPTSEPSYQARLLKWNTALEDIDDYPFGHGVGTAGIAEERYGRFTTVASSNLDNSYLKVAYEQGIVALALFGTALIALLVGLARRALFATERYRAGLGMGAAGALAALSVIMFTELAVEGLTALAAWLVIGLGVAQFAAPRDDDSARGPHAAPSS